MGLLEWLFGKKGPEFTERISLTTECKINDLVRKIRSAQDSGGHSVVVTHFKATQAVVLEALGKAGVNFHVVTNSAGFPSNVADVLTQGKSTLVLASDAIPSFAASTAGSQQKDATLASISVHLAEHYPRPDRDQRVLALDDAWPMRIEFIGYTGLDEPWMVAFGSERLQSIIQRLALPQDEVLQHPWLNRSIQTAQRRVAQTLFRDQVCDSCEEWMRINGAGTGIQSDSLTHGKPAGSNVGVATSNTSASGSYPTGNPAVDYKRAIAYLDQCGVFDERKLRETNRIAGNMLSEGDIQTILSQSRMIIPTATEPGGMEFIKASIREKLVTFTQIVGRLGL